MTRPLTRRALLYGGTIGSLSIFVRRLKAADFRFRQFHNQTAESPLHRRLTEMWRAISVETNGRVETRVLAQNDNIPGSDPQALKMLLAGELEFFTLMGGALGPVVPVAEVQQVPFIFRSATDAHGAVDGPLGLYVQEEMAAKGIRGFRVGAFDNGMRQIGSVERSITVPADLVGLKMRVPVGSMIADMFRTLGAEPVSTTSSVIYETLKSRRADAQENPLALMELFKLYEVTKYVSMTNHGWAGFNLMAHLPTWRALPDELKSVIERNVTKAVRLQRQDQASMNRLARTILAGHGLLFNEVDAAPFRRQLAGFYAAWKARLGRRCWALLESATGAVPG